MKVGDLHGVEPGSDPAVIGGADGYRMFLSQRDRARDVSTIVLFTSADGSTWNRGGQVLDVGPKGAWDDTNAEVASVLVENGRYRLWYGGASGTRYQIGYAESSDGVHFAKLPAPSSPYGAEGLVLSPDDTVDGSMQAVADPSVVRVGDDLMLYHGGFTSDGLAISLATSRDGVHWQRQGIVMRSSLPWEKTEKGEGSVVQPSVVYDAGRFAMAYATFADDGSVAAIGYATSRDGVRWSKSKQPVIVPERGEVLFTGPSLLRDGGALNLY